MATRCRRCKGLMVPVRLEETAGATSGTFLTGWRCLQCGEVLDPVIEANRKSKTQPAPIRKPRLPIAH
jgi:RNase P subunit RPR2